MLKAAFFVYILPLIAVSAGIYLGYFLLVNFKINHLLPMAIGGFVLGLIAILVIKHLDMALADDMPKIAKVIK
jgi:sigma-E factor negative regulatory protein RseC